jgi:hypothetical protein
MIRLIAVAVLGLGPIDSIDPNFVEEASAQLVISLTCR